ncbi:MAG: DUF1800 family protein [Lautropia sp.]
MSPCDAWLRRCVGWPALLLAGALAGCSSGSSDSAEGAAAGGVASVAEAAVPPADGGSGGLAATEPDRPTTAKDASRLLHQATFGPNTAAIDQVRQQGPRKYLLAQMDVPVSRYSYTLSANRHRSAMHTSGSRAFCNQASGAERDQCWRDYFSPLPVQWEFFRHAVGRDDQLRQRLAFVWAQIFVTSARELESSYGFAEYNQMLRDHAFANYRTLLEKVITSPFMGAYLNMANNDRSDPNENFAREMLQLFSIGPCALTEDGQLPGGKCNATYSNEVVRSYAYALTGWTYPDGGVDPWCDARCRGNDWRNPRYYRGVMIGKAAGHDDVARPLLSGIVVPGNRTPQQALALVLDSLMAHPNIGPFVGRQLIQFLVTSNPSAAYVGRVARVFRQGVFSDAHGSIGSGQAGDIRATIAAVLLDAEARDPAAATVAGYGRLREPAQYLAGAIRAAEGSTDAESIAPEWGYSGQMGQPPFQAPSVFNYYPPDFPLTGTALVAPQFGIESLNASLARINFANALIYWWSDRGSTPGTIPGATGTRISYARWESQISGTGDSAKIVDQLDELLASGRLGANAKAAIVAAMDVWNPSQTWLANQNPPSNWKRERVKTALYLILSSPHYQVQR